MYPAGVSTDKPGRFSSSRILAALLGSCAEPPYFALLGAFVAQVAFFPDLPFFDATCGTISSGDRTYLN